MSFGTFTRLSTGSNEKKKHSVPSVISSCSDHTKIVLEVSFGRKFIMVGNVAMFVLKSVQSVEVSKYTYFSHNYIYTVLNMRTPVVLWVIVIFTCNDKYVCPCLKMSTYKVP